MGKESVRTHWMKFKTTPEGKGVIEGSIIAGIATALALTVNALAPKEPGTHVSRQTLVWSDGKLIPSAPVCKIEGGFIQRGMDAAMRTCDAKNRLIPPV